MAHPRLRLATLVCACAFAGAVAPRTPAWGADPAVKAEMDLIAKHAKDPTEQDDRVAAIRRLGALGTREAVQALAPLFADPFEHLGDHVVSAWTAALKGPHDAEVQTWLAQHALGHRDARVRAGAATALGVTGGAELADAFQAAVAREEEPQVLVALARAARLARGGALVPKAFLPHLAHADGEAALAAAEVVVALGPEAEAPLRRTLQHAHPLARAGAVLGLQRLGKLTEADLARIWADKAHEPRMALADTLELRTALLPWPGQGEIALRNLLEDPSWRVRAAAIDAALRMWERGVVLLLIDRLAKETGRLKADAHVALCTLTGESLGDDPELWNAWFAQKGPGLVLGPRPEPDRYGRIKRGEARILHAGGGQVETHTTAFFDLALRSSRMMFVLDLSGSMGKAATQTGDVGRGDPSKLDLTRRELDKTLGALPDGTALDVLVYRYPSTFPPRPEVTRALGKLTPLQKASRERASDWLRAQSAKGWGAFYEALLAASEEDVDTIVLLSDGVPSRGRFDRPERLLEAWTRANRFRRVAIHTVLVGDRATDRALMEDLAWATWGRTTVAGGS
jgi:HEAT repeat protein